MPFGSSIAVFHIGRTDVDAEADVPRFDPPNDKNTESEQWKVKRTGDKLYRIEGEFWRDEWIEPAPTSPRVRGDKLPSTMHYIIDEAGTKASSDELNDEDKAAYLWFAPAVVPALANRRAGSLVWHTRETGGVRASPEYSRVHFGVNDKGLVTVYAYDVAKLPEWEQRIWLGHNVAPDGKVSRELLDAQMKVRPANTIAPEQALVRILEKLNAAAQKRWGAPLFRDHESTTEILRTIHRFRGTDNAGVLALAKDLARLTADSINVTLLQKLVPLAKGESRGSLRSLEKALGTIVDAEVAHLALSRLVGIYELRLGDAHLPSSTLDDAFMLAGVDKSALPLTQAIQLLDAAVAGLEGISAIIE